ncbi:hypothetical protein KZ851_30855, partial [Pseudomonas aeruginosa]
MPQPLGGHEGLAGAAPRILAVAAMLEARLCLADREAAYAILIMAASQTTLSMVGNATPSRL